MRSSLNRGFIALMSAIIISAVLLIIATSGSLTGFSERSAILNSELKKRSATAADACADQAFLLIANDPAYADSFSLTFNSLDSCEATVVDGMADQKVITVQATSVPAVTNLYIEYDADAFSVTRWEEIPTY